MRNRLAIIMLAFSVLASTVNVNGKQQHYYFNHYTTRDGLPSNTIYNILQDKSGFIWISTRDGIVRFDGNGFVKVEMDEGESILSGGSTTTCMDEGGSIWFCSKNRVCCYDPFTGSRTTIGEFGNMRANSIVSDKKGNIWFVAGDLNRYEKETGELVVYPRDKYPMPSSLVCDASGTIWLLGIGGDLHRYDSRTDNFERISVPRLSRLESTASGKLLACTANSEIMTIEPHTFEFETILTQQETADWRRILCMTERAPGEYWIGTETGIRIYQEGRGLIQLIQENPMDKHAISASYVMKMFADKDGNIWAGTYYTGLNLWQNKKEAYQMYYDYKDENSITGNIIRPIKAGSDNIIWFGTEDGELNRYDLIDHETQTYQTKDLFYNIQDILPDKNEIWVATYGNGLMRYNPTTRKVTAQYQIGNGYVIRLFRAADNVILAGTRNGLFRYDESAKSFEPIESVTPHFIHALYQDHNGNIWIGTLGSGVRVTDRDFNLVARIDDAHDNGMYSNHITSIFEDSRNRIWITTEGAGVFYSEPGSAIENIKFKNLTQKDGIPSDVTCSVIEDRDGFIWISTTQGICRFNPEDSSINTTYFKKSQVSGGQYTFSSSLITPSGTIFMGTTDGMISFSPAILNTIVPGRQLYITEINAVSYNKTTNLANAGHNNLDSDKIKVKSKDVSTLEISFASPDYSGIMDLEYQYSLTSHDRQYRTQPVTTSNTKAIYSNINPGRYTFTVKMLGCDWPGTSRKVNIKVVPPFYLTEAAKILYVLMVLGAAGMIVYLISRRRKDARKRSLAQLENDKQKEIYDAKIKYFTNITHEIRTPLSLIKMPVDKILATEGYKASAHEDMLTIKANTERLLELTNQLLDLRKVEQKEFKLIFTKEDIRDIVLKSCDYFMTTAKERHIDLNVSTPDSPVKVVCAEESIKKILTNLISNAIKYGKDRIDVILTDDDAEGKVSVRVNSNGVIIAKADRTRIFEPFYQARMSDDQMKGSNGTGLGLPFARSLAELHSGRLYLDDSVTGFNSFVLEIPKEQTNAVHIKEDDDKSDNIIQSIDSSRHTILVVEDSPEMRSYLGKELSEEYNTLLTANGEEALKIVEEQKVDLVVSDIMMPVMDGCELCNRIKTDIDYCHIPVILLTAAVGVETRIETLKVGADGYIEKPFSIDLLKANISNIFKNKEISFRQFTESPLSHYNGVVVNSIDDDFMNRLHEEVMNHLSEQDLNIESLTAILGTSKSTLYRKIKANTGLNINEYIRLCRLKEAAEMLSSQKYRINEVAYLVGFSSPSYFTTSFQKQFNISPSAFVKRIKQED